MEQDTINFFLIAWQVSWSSTLYKNVRHSLINLSGFSPQGRLSMCQCESGNASLPKVAPKAVKHRHPGFFDITKTIFSNFGMWNELPFGISCLLGFYLSRGEVGGHEGLGSEMENPVFKGVWPARLTSCWVIKDSFPKYSHGHFSSFLAFDPLFLTFSPVWSPQPHFFFSFPRKRNKLAEPLVTVPCV